LSVGFSDVYLRDFAGDVGDPHTGSISTSPDIIVRPTSVADPLMAFGEGSGTENSEVLGYEVEAGQDNFVYARVRNRGSTAATNAEVTVYWSEVATLVTPDMWNLVGSQVIPSVPAGDILTVADEIVWSAAAIPGPGHYCFVGTVGTADDPVPPLANLVNFDNFMAFIRDNNNITWRNFNVIDMDASAMAFMIAGAPDRALPMGLEVIANLPEKGKLMLEAPEHLLERLGFRGPQLKRDGENVRLTLAPHGRQSLGVLRFPAKFRARVRLIAELPRQARQHSGWQVAVRQYVLEPEQEVGRVTWYLAGPEFFKRRKRVEACLFDQRVG
jgi:hypothetical protein